MSSMVGYAWIKCQPHNKSVGHANPPYGDAVPLQIQHQPLALAAGATDHHPLVLGLLFLAQDRVVVLGDAFDDALLAGAADAELAGIVDVDALIEQHLEDGAALRNEELLARARELDREAALLGLGDVL